MYVFFLHIKKESSLLPGTPWQEQYLFLFLGAIQENGYVYTGVVYLYIVYNMWGMVWNASWP